MHAPDRLAANGHSAGPVWLGASGRRWHAVGHETDSPELTLIPPLAPLSRNRYANAARRRVEDIERLAYGAAPSLPVLGAKQRLLIRETFVFAFVFCVVKETR